jgi:hypothetical protein
VRGDLHSLVDDHPSLAGWQLPESDGMTLPAGWAEAPLTSGGIAMVTHWCTAGPKGLPEYVYGPETSVYRTAREGEFVTLGGASFSWDDRAVYVCRAQLDGAVMILHADDLIGCAPT